jgi:hypothetical protein
MSFFCIPVPLHTFQGVDVSYVVSFDPQSVYRVDSIIPFYRWGNRDAKTPKVIDIYWKWVENLIPNDTYYLYRINGFSIHYLV